MEILTAGPVWRANMHQRAKFRANCMNRCVDMAVFRFFKMAAVRHLGFWKVRNFNCPSGSDGQYAPPSQFSCRAVEPLQRHGRFSTFQDGGVRRPPSWIWFLKVGNFTYRSDGESQYASPRQILCRSVERLRRYGRFSIFQDGGRPPSWICFTCI